MKINLIARAGVRVPIESKPRQYITDAESVAVEMSHYYQQQINDGDLLQAEATEAPIVTVKKGDKV